jgi:hypothetical protein
MLNLHKVRRGQVFSFTLTELILLILFILLLLLWVITDKKNKELSEWSKVTGADTPQQYKALYPNFPDKTTSPNERDRLKAELSALKEENKELKEMLKKFAEKTGKDNPEELPLNTKSIIKKAEGMGRNPPCWPKGWPNNPDYEKADKIFNVIFLGNDKLAVIPDFEDIYKDQYKLLPIDTSILSSYEDYKNNTMNIISSKDFIKSFNRLLDVSKKEMDNKHPNLTLRRDCRHEVRVF